MNDISLNIQRLIANTMPNSIMAALNDACQLIENDAVDNCPVDDGVLRASITHNVKKENTSFVGAIGSNEEYAPFAHEGTGIYAKGGNGRSNVPWVYRDVEGNFHSTKGQQPNPFLQNAIDQNMSNILRKFEGCLDDS
jgi:hypothetical protein